MEASAKKAEGADEGDGSAKSIGSNAVPSAVACPLSFSASKDTTLSFIVFLWEQVKEQRSREGWKEGSMLDFILSSVWLFR